MICTWQERWNHEENRRWTHSLIPNIRVWFERQHGNMGYYLTQAMTNHGSFNKYLHRFKLKEISSCESCGALDEDANHILFECEKWLEQRQALSNKLGVTLTAENLVNVMLLSANAWKLCDEFIIKVIKERCTAVPNLPT